MVEEVGKTMFHQLTMHLSYTSQLGYFNLLWSAENKCDLFFYKGKKNFMTFDAVWSQDKKDSFYGN